MFQKLEQSPLLSYFNNNTIFKNNKFYLMLSKLPSQTLSTSSHPSLSLSFLPPSQSQQLKSHGFLIKTYNLLQSQSFKDIIDWIPSCNGFIIYNIERFQGEVLPMYFKHSNLQSFVRQLNMYGFHKIRTSKDVNYYTHECFVKGDKEKIRSINRKAEKKMIKRNSIQEKLENEMEVQNMKEEKIVKQQTKEIIQKQRSKEVNPKLQVQNQKQKQQKANLNYLPIILKMNLNLMQQQNYLIQVLKKQLQNIEKTRSIEKKQRQQNSNTNLNLRSKIEQERTMRTLDTYWNMQQQMYSKLYMESIIMLNKDDRVPETHTSIAKI